MKYKNKDTVLNKIDINEKKMCLFLILTLFLIFQEEDMWNVFYIGVFSTCKININILLK